jgi:ribosomal protein S18 acetylase RimI-like enzyme
MIKFTKPEEKYIESFWKTVDTVAKENIYLAMTKAFPLEDTIKFIKSSIETNIPQLFVIDTHTNNCVGWGDAMPTDEKTGYLGTGLLAEYRDQGIGQRLLQEVIELSKAYGYNSIELDVRSSNKRAIHVYEKAGFAITNVVVGGFTLMGNEVAEDVVHMELSLSER